MRSFYSSAPKTKLPDSPIKIVLISNANLEDSQRASLLSAVAPRRDTNTTTDMDDALEKIKYEDVLSRIIKFDKPKGLKSNNESILSLSAYKMKYRNKYKCAKPKHTFEQVKKLKERNKCKACYKFGH